MRHRRGRGRLSRRLARGRGLRQGAREGPAGDRARARALQRHDVAADGELGGCRWHDRPLHRRQSRRLRPLMRSVEPTRIRYRWVILAAGTIAQASFACASVALPALGPALRTDFELSLGEVGVVLGAISIGMLFTFLPWG